MVPRKRKKKGSARRLHGVINFSSDGLVRPTLDEVRLNLIERYDTVQKKAIYQIQSELDQEE